ncbi:MAG: two-component system response regulator BtsR [Thermodesulfobacteriota bacterium]
MIRAIVVDDEIHARDELSAMLVETGAFEVVAGCGHAIEALKALKAERPEVMFLDIRMPGLSGFELLSMIDEEIMPTVVFVTAYDEYALRAFEENAVDYLLKPIEPERLKKTVQKLNKMARQSSRPLYPPAPIGRIPCVSGQRIRLISLTDIDFVRSDVAGVYVVTSEGEYFTELTLKVLEARTNLVRCHKQFLVNIDRVDEILLQENQAAQIRMSDGKVAPVSRRYLKRMKDQFGF